MRDHPGPPDSLSSSFQFVSPGSENGQPITGSAFMGTRFQPNYLMFISLASLLTLFLGIFILALVFLLSILEALERFPQKTSVQFNYCITSLRKRLMLRIMHTMTLNVEKADLLYCNSNFFPHESFICRFC
jgi:hypothetical protein